MSVSHLRVVTTPTSDLTLGDGARRAPARLGALLVGSGDLTAKGLSHALEVQAKHGTQLGEILRVHGAIPEARLYDALARQHGAELVVPADHLRDAHLIDTLGVAYCLSNGVLPLRQIGAATLLATSRPERFIDVRDEIEAKIGPVLLAISTQTDLRETLLACRARRLAKHAETRTPLIESCREFGSPRARRHAMVAAAVGLVALGVFPWLVFSILLGLGLLALTANTVLMGTVGALRLADRSASRPSRSAVPVTHIARQPKVSLLVPLFRERHITTALIERLSLLTYPHDLLEICLIVEQDDSVTRDTIAAAHLPHWMTCITVPRGPIQTKPRALNYAMDFCEGNIIGVYDAEDAPDPDQITAVVNQFLKSPPEVACLQGRLDFYNPAANWMSRCFTIEYATWFSVVLPGLRKLGLVIPLGGTTLFFRREALEKLGGWDAHNVTEDADLGLRLARHGYRTDLLDSVTGEEANCRPWPWVRQRSRWIKGYALTYAVHMRDPVQLWNDLGPKRFFGVQLLFLGSISGVLLAPFVWTFWLMFAGLPHPWHNVVPDAALTGIWYGLMASAVIHWGTAMVALDRPHHRFLRLWVPVTQFYFVLGTVAALKAAVEIVTKPFFWDKTAHGLMPEGAVPQTGDPASEQPVATGPDLLPAQSPPAPEPTPHRSRPRPKLVSQA